MTTARHDWPLWHVAGRTLALVMRAVPKKYRIDAAMGVAWLVTPIIERTRMYTQSWYRVETSREMTLHRLLDVLTLAGTPFDLRLAVEGAEDLQKHFEAGSGVMIVGTHSMLGLLIIRYLHDIGRPPLVVSTDNLRIRGTSETAENIPPTPGFMLRVRRRLRAGGVVCVAIDRSESSTRTVRLDTARGPVYISSAMFELAARAHAKVMFVHCGLQDGRLRLMLESPRSCEGVRAADQMTREFVRFVSARLPEGEAVRVAHGTGALVFEQPEMLALEYAEQQPQ